MLATNPAGPPPTKACHNCRRRRWRCDKSVPSCRKCRNSGVQCLGYGQLFIWRETEGLGRSSQEDRTGVGRNSGFESGGSGIENVIGDAGRGDGGELGAGTRKRKRRKIHDDAREDGTVRMTARDCMDRRANSKILQPSAPDVFDGQPRSQWVSFPGNPPEEAEASDLEINRPPSPRPRNAATSTVTTIETGGTSVGDVGSWTSCPSFPSQNRSGNSDLKRQNSSVSRPLLDASSPSIISQFGPAVVDPEHTEPPLDVEIQVLEHEAPSTSLSFPLRDPLLQSLHPQTRSYLLHFTRKFCADIVVHDIPGQNPIRELVPRATSQPLLLNVMVANAALHVHNLRQQRDGDRQDKTTRPYQHSLIAKLTGLAMLGRLAPNVNESNYDVVLAAVLLFINYDLIESGTDSWKVHFEGARGLISLLGEQRFESAIPMSRLRFCLLADAVVFFILGSTLSSTTPPSHIVPTNLDLDAILTYAETNNYLSCPAPLLKIMLRSFSIPQGSISASRACRAEADDRLIIQQRRIAALLSETLAFDPLAWATRSLSLASPHENLQSRIHVASAHRLAVCLFITRNLPRSSFLFSRDPIPIPEPQAQTSSSQDRGAPRICPAVVASAMMRHMESLTPDDSLYKSLTWPLFLAGAEARCRSEQRFIVERLDRLWADLGWGYVCTVRQVLDQIWHSRERRSGAIAEDVTQQGTADVGWAEEVRRMGREILIA